MAAQPPPQILIPPPVPQPQPGTMPGGAPPLPGGPPPLSGMAGKPTPRFGPDGKPLPVLGSQNPAGAAGDLPPEEAVHLSFWQQPWVQNVLPFLTSLAFHAAIVVVG